MRITVFLRHKVDDAHVIRTALNLRGTTQDGTDLASCNGQESEALVESICNKTNDLKMGCPHVKKNANCRWNVCAQNCS